MTKILINFEVSFEINISEFSMIKNIYQNFIHNCKKNANVLKTGFETANLKVWWEPNLSFYNLLDCNTEVMNYNYNKYFYYNQWENSRKEKKHKMPDVGPLYGEIEISEIAKEEAKALINEKIGDPDYISLGERIINNYLFPHVYRYFTCMGINNGFFYIREFKNWDPNEESLGSFCRKLNMKWSIDDGETWKDFIPDYPLIFNEGIYYND